MRVVVATGPQPLEVDAPAEETSSSRPCRPGVVISAIEADVTEEVARVRGYELIPEILPDTPMPAYRQTPLRLRDHVRATLAGAGLTEAVTFALVSPAQVERFGPASDVLVPGEGAPGGAPVVVSNPLSSQHSVMRQSLIGSLLEVVPRTSATAARTSRSSRSARAMGPPWTGRGPTSGGASAWP